MKMCRANDGREEEKGSKRGIQSTDGIRIDVRHEPQGWSMIQGTHLCNTYQKLACPISHCHTLWRGSIVACGRRWIAETGVVSMGQVPDGGVGGAVAGACTAGWMC